MEEEHKKEWIEAIQDGMKSLHENHTFELVKLPKGKQALKNKWVYRVKPKEHASQPRYKEKVLIMMRFFLLLLRCPRFVL